MKLLGKCLTTTVAGLLRIMLGFYFRRVELFHAERVPSNGPVLFASNHPGSVTDAFIIGTSVPRQVHFVATVQLFRFAPLAWLRSEEHTSELQSQFHLVCRLLLEKKKPGTRSPPSTPRCGSPTFSSQPWTLSS